MARSQNLITVSIEKNPTSQLRLMNIDWKWWLFSEARKSKDQTLLKIVGNPESMHHPKDQPLCLVGWTSRVNISTATHCISSTKDTSGWLSTILRAWISCRNDLLPTWATTKSNRPDTFHWNPGRLKGILIMVCYQFTFHEIPHNWVVFHPL